MSILWAHTNKSAGYRQSQLFWFHQRIKTQTRKQFSTVRLKHNKHQVGDRLLNHLSAKVHVKVSHKHVSSFARVLAGKIENDSLADYACAMACGIICSYVSWMQSWLMNCMYSHMVLSVNA